MGTTVLCSLFVPDTLNLEAVRPVHQEISTGKSPRMIMFSASDQWLLITCVSVCRGLSSIVSRSI
jgi:hypothetical protein